MNTTTKRKGTENDLLAAIQRPFPASPTPEPVQGGGTGAVFSATKVKRKTNRSPGVR